MIQVAQRWAERHRSNARRFVSAKLQWRPSSVDVDLCVSYALGVAADWRCAEALAVHATTAAGEAAECSSRPAAERTDGSVGQYFLCAGACVCTLAGL